LNEKDAYKNVTKKNANQMKELMQDGGGVLLAQIGD
jgi:hypothetical protein